MFFSEKSLVIQQIARMQIMVEEFGTYIDKTKMEVVVIEDEPKIKIYDYYLDWSDADYILREIKKIIKLPAIKPAKKLVVKPEEYGGISDVKMPDEDEEFLEYNK
jgi:hypothetical protein